MCKNVELIETWQECHHSGSKKRYSRRDGDCTTELMDPHSKRRMFSKWPAGWKLHEIEKQHWQFPSSSDDFVFCRSNKTKHGFPWDPINKKILAVSMYKAPKQVKWNENPDGMKFNKITMTVGNGLFINKVTRLFFENRFIALK